MRQGTYLAWGVAAVVGEGDLALGLCVWFRNCRREFYYTSTRLHSLLTSALRFRAEGRLQREGRTLVGERDFFSIHVSELTRVLKNALPILAR